MFFKIKNLFIIFLLLLSGCGFSNLNKLTSYNNVYVETPDEKYNILFKNSLKKTFNINNSTKTRYVLRATGDKSVYWCKQFAFITGVFTGSECVVEKYRGKHDVWNQVVSGCVAGAAIQAKNGPMASATGCAGFAAFSLVIEQIMGEH